MEHLHHDPNPGGNDGHGEREQREVMKRTAKDSNIQTKKEERFWQARFLVNK